LTKTVEFYLKENIDDDVTIKPWGDKNLLPVFLKSLYEFYEMIILDVPCILLEVPVEGPGISVIKKHIGRVEELTNQQIVLYYKEITRYRRKSLIENRIPFIIDDGQIFLPFLGLSLKKTLQYVGKEVTRFSASAQLAFLYFLYNREAVVNTSELAQKLGFSVMTASRALNELVDTKLVTYELGGKTRRSKEYKRIPDPAYFETGRVYMNTPVKQVVYVQKTPENALIAGLEALAAISMINPPSYPVRAIGSKWLKKQAIKIIKNRDLIKDQTFVELEIWDYDPKLLTDQTYVDIMSLYASLQEEKDERVEQALEEVLRGEIWSTD